MVDIYTQITEPNNLPFDTVWLPCLKTETVKHLKAWKQPIIITHIEAIKHYEYDYTELLDQYVYCIGNRTSDRLKEMNFTKVEMQGLFAKDIQIDSRPLTPCTWLHGNKYSRDFSKYVGVTAIQTYTSSLNEESLKTIYNFKNVFLSKIRNIYVYSNQVLKALEEIHLPEVILHYTESCKPNSNLWAKTKSFYPKDPAVRFEQ